MSRPVALLCGHIPGFHREVVGYRPRILKELPPSRRSLRGQNYSIAVLLNIDFGTFKTEFLGNPDRLASSVLEELGNLSCHLPRHHQVFQ